MTFAEKTATRYKSPSLTPDRQNHFQSERNEDSAPQHLTAALAADDGAGRAIGDVTEPVRVPLPGGLFALVDAADGERVLAHRWRDGTSSSRGQVFRVGSRPPVWITRLIRRCSWCLSQPERRR